jgi:hypothetical protein
MSNLLKLLQPIEYKSKIKLFCREKNLEVKKHSETLAQVKDNTYICRGIMKIKEI